MNFQSGVSVASGWARLGMLSDNQATRTGAEGELNATIKMVLGIP